MSINVPGHKVFPKSAHKLLFSLSRYALGGFFGTARWKHCNFLGYEDLEYLTTIQHVNMSNYKCPKYCGASCNRGC